MFMKTSLHAVQCFKTKPAGLAYVEKWHHHLKVKDSQHLKIKSALNGTMLGFPKTRNQSSIAKKINKPNLHFTNENTEQSDSASI